jgi:hypothetical protein
MVGKALMELGVKVKEATLESLQPSLRKDLPHSRHKLAPSKCCLLQ